MKLDFSQAQRNIDRPDGDVSLDEAIKIVEIYVSSQKDFWESADDPFAISIFSFAKDRKNFIELAIDSKTDFRARLVCPIPKEFLFLRWMGEYSKEWHIPTEVELIQIVKHYFQMNDEAMQSYFDKLPYKLSPSRY